VFNDIFIGEGFAGFTAITRFDANLKNTHICENRISYWCTDSVTKLDITIMKNTPEGQHLEELLSTQAPEHDIQDYLTEIVLKRLKPAQLRKLITEVSKASFEKGYRELQDRFKELMQLF
jgi:phage gp16-like protein